LSDMIRDPLFRPEDIERERSVILEEIKMYKDLPSHYVHDLVSELLWPNQSLGRQLIGTEKTLSGITKGDILKFKKEHYSPKQLLISVCGAIDHDEVFKQAMRFFSEKPRPSAPGFARARSAQRSAQFDIRHKDTEQTHFVIGLHGLSRFDKRRYQFGLLNTILGGNMSSRLYEEVREKRGLAYDIRSQVGFHHDAGFFVISAGVEPRKTPLALRVILKQLKLLKTHPVSEGELKRAKDYFLGQFCLMLEDTLDHMLWSGEQTTHTGKIPSRDEINQKIEKATVSDIKRLSCELLRSNHLNLALIGPIDGKLERTIKKDFSL